MIFSILNDDVVKNDKLFKECIECIKELYWPESVFIDKKDEYINKLNENEFVNAMKMGNDILTKAKWDNIIIKETRDCLRNIINSISENGTFTPMKYNSDNNTLTKIAEKQKFPYVNRYYYYFLEREWIKPYKNFEKSYHSLICLKPCEEKDNSSSDFNYSKNLGNYNHFVNVVAAIVRVIKYFSRNRNLEIKWIFQGYKNFFSDYFENILYSNTPNKRTILLVLAAFFHDLGKTVVDHRHGVEGGIIIEDHAAEACSELNTIFNNYTNNVIELDYEDLIYISNLLHFHDLFGNLSTGEDNYVNLIAITEKLMRYSLKDIIEDDNKSIFKYSQRYMFDLWVLNFVDTITSLEKKYELQEHWFSEKSSKSHIEKFINTKLSKSKEFEFNKFSIFKHDLNAALNFMNILSKSRHFDNFSSIIEETTSYSKSHTIERIIRLIRASCNEAIKKIHHRFDEDSKITEKRINTIKDEINKANNNSLRSDLKLKEHDLEEHLKTLSNQEKTFINTSHDIENTSYSNLNHAISRAIETTGNYDEFCERFSKIGKMDYALGFFSKIASRAIENKYRNKSNIEPFMDNYISLVVQIIHLLMYREKTIDSHRNLEFFDAVNRLTNDKIDHILGQNGPYRLKRSIQLILKSIFIY